jgi:hypothetical protein
MAEQLGKQKRTLCTPGVLLYCARPKMSRRLGASDAGVSGLFRKVFRFDLVPDRFAPRFLACFAALPVLTLWLLLASCPDAVLAASPDSPQQGAPQKSDAAEAWDAVKNTTNPALLEAFIKRYGKSFFAEIAKARLGELKAAATRPSPADAKATPKEITTSPDHPDSGLEALKDRFHQNAILYEEDASTPTGRQFAGSVTWHTETIKADGKPDELAANADVYIPSRGLRMTMSVRRNLDPSLPASHVIELSCAVPADFAGGGIANVPGVLTKSNQQAKGVPLAAITVKVTSGFFLVGLSSKPGDLERNLKLLLQRAWFDIPIVYANQHRAILAIDKGESGEQVFKTVLTAWGQYPDAAQPAAAIPERGNDNAGAR